MRRYTTHQKNYAIFFNLYRQKSGEFVWKLILRVQDNNVNNIKLDWAEYMNMGPISIDSGLKHAAQ